MNVEYIKMELNSKKKSHKKSVSISFGKRVIEAKKSFFDFIIDFFKNSNIHGLRYVVARQLTTLEKCFWTTLVIFSIFITVQFSLSSMERYKTKSTVVGLERDYYFWNTTMPSVTICPLKRIDLNLFDEYCNISQIEESQRKPFFDFVEHLANSTFKNFKNLPNESTTIQQLLHALQITPSKYIDLIYNLTGDKSVKTKLEYENLEKLVRSTADEIFIESRQILTEYGLCYMTNTMLSDKYTSQFMIWGKYPQWDVRELPGTIKVKQSSFFDDDNSYNFLGFGENPIDIFLSSAYEVMQIDHNLGYINDAVEIEVTSREIITENNFESGASIEQRKCRFQHESNLEHYPIYTRNLCLQECRLNLVFKICGCIPHFYPNKISKPKTVCHFSVLTDCFVKNEKYFVTLYDASQNNTNVNCHCVENCRDAIVTRRKFVADSQRGILMGGNSAVITLIDLPTIRLKRMIIFTFTDLLVSVGGTAGLFMGLSVLGLAEVLYYLSIKLFLQLLKVFCRRN